LNYLRWCYTAEELRANIKKEQSHGLFAKATS